IVACNTISAVVGYFTIATSSSEPEAVTWEADSAELTSAASPVMAPVLADLAESFNAQALRAPDGRSLKVSVTPYDPEAMVRTAVQSPPFQAISPDSTLWLDRLEQLWAQRASEGTAPEAAMPIGQRRVSAQTRYAVSPIVLAAWEDVARRLGWPDRPV